MLSLPLAFILSQDQTLHRIFFILLCDSNFLTLLYMLTYSLFFLFWSVWTAAMQRRYKPKRLSIQYVIERVLLLLFWWNLAGQRLYKFAILWVSGCKSNHIFLSGKLFLIYFLNLFAKPIFQYYCPIAGCKDSHTLFYHKLFWRFFLKVFLMYWILASKTIRKTQ